MNKTTQLKNILQAKQIDFLMEAHNGLSSRIVEEFGAFSIKHSEARYRGSRREVV